MRPLRAWAHTRSLGVALFAAALAAPAAASEVVTINTSNAYVDPSVAEQFVTVPTLCAVNPNPNVTILPAATTECNELGVRALAAINRTGPDVYWEPAGTPLGTTNSFVPGNNGLAVNDTGYAPLFSDHKYDLFGRAGDIMGPLTRREILFMDNITTTGGGLTVGQTTPGEDTIYALVRAVLAAPQGSPTITAGGEVFDIADLPTYGRITPFTTGQRNVVINYCTSTYGFGSCINAEFAAGIYIEDHYPDIVAVGCSTKDDPTGITYSNCLARDQWMDQVVTGYVEAWESLGGDLHFAQNFRSQVGYDGTSTKLLTNTEVWGDFRLQQSVELSGSFTTNPSDPGDLTTPGDNQDGIAGRQTIEMALATESQDDFGWIYPNQEYASFGQLVSQDVQGFLFTCMNCDTPFLLGTGAAHEFAPAKLDLTYMEYDSGWNVVPTVIHAP